MEVITTGDESCRVCGATEPENEGWVWTTGQLQPVHEDGQLTGYRAEPDAQPYCSGKCLVVEGVQGDAGSDVSVDTTHRCERCGQMSDSTELVGTNREQIRLCQRCQDD